MYRDRVRQIYQHLAPSYRKVADFLLNNYQEAAFMTASALAEHLDVDTATVVRCAQRLGYTGYPDLQDELQNLVLEDLRRSRQPIAQAHTPSEHFRNVLLSQQQALSDILTHTPTQTIDDIIVNLRRARHVLVLGEGFEENLARLFAEQLSALGMNAVAVPTDRMSRAIALRQVSAEDVVVALSMTQFVSGLGGALNIANKAGAQTMALVGALTTPVARLARIVMVTPGDPLTMVPNEALLSSILAALVHVLAASNEPNQEKFQTVFLRLLQESEQSPAELREMLADAKNAAAAAAAAKEEDGAAKQ